MRWRPFDIVEGNFIHGLKTVCGAGDPTVRNGVATHVYSCTQSMEDAALYNSDGDFLIGTYCVLLLIISLFVKACLINIVT